MVNYVYFRTFTVFIRVVLVQLVLPMFRVIFSVSDIPVFYCQVWLGLSLLGVCKSLTCQII